MQHEFKDIYRCVFSKMQLLFTKLMLSDVVHIVLFLYFKSSALIIYMIIRISKACKMITKGTQQQYHKIIFIVIKDVRNVGIIVLLRSLACSRLKEKREPYLFRL